MRYCLLGAARPQASCARSALSKRAPGRRVWLAAHRRLGGVRRCSNAR